MVLSRAPRISFDPLQVVQVGAGEIAAGVAGARRVERARVVAVARVADA